MQNAQNQLPGPHDLLEARKRISPWIHQTPVMGCQTLNRITGAELYFKCENFQKAGAFKFRGATNAILSLHPDDAARGVATHSSGNHAQALALAASSRGIKAYIVMPKNAPRIKVEAVKGYLGEITFCEPNLASREETLRKVIEATGAVEIHPYNDYRIMAGQSTAAQELFEAGPVLDYLITPLGGGGLLSGSILAAGAFSPGTRVIGAEPLQANDAWQSWQSKTFVPSVNPNTIADGLRTSLGSLTFPIIMQGADGIITATEEGIVRAMMLIWERMKIVVEASAAVPLAALMENPDRFRGKKTGIILSGGNTDLMALPWHSVTN